MMWCFPRVKEDFDYMPLNGPQKWLKIPRSYPHFRHMVSHARELFEVPATFTLELLNDAYVKEMRDIYVCRHLNFFERRQASGKLGQMYNVLLTSLNQVETH